MSWPCFWVETTGEAEIFLRRYRMRDEAPGEHFHSATAATGVRQSVRLTDDHAYEWIEPDEWKPHNLWPTTCECGYEFVNEDTWHVSQEPVYVRPDTGETWLGRTLPIGALYHAAWWAMWGVGDDGIALQCVLPRPDGVGGWEPDHPWHVDGPARSEGTSKPNAWSRTGDPRSVPPTVDVNPSILTSHYHGYLRHGVLTDPV